MKKINYIFENGCLHKEAAGLLADAQMYGFAVSYLILSMEEFIKYIVLLEKSFDKNIFETTEIDDIFKKHSTKHMFIKEFQSRINETSFELILDEFLHNLSSSDTSENPTPELKIPRFTAMGSFLKIAYNNEQFNEAEKKEFIHWLNNAPKIKNFGFYSCNPNEKEKCPIDFSLADYQKTLFYNDKIFKQASVYNELGNNDEDLDFLK